MNKRILLYLCSSLVFTSFSQKKEETPNKAPINWYLDDPKSDGIYGVGAERAYDLLNAAGKKPKQVIVAVIDSGVETDHPDLKDVIWVNEDEIPGNGIDDDKNGYIDDVHGWSFLGGATTDINNEATELSRMYHMEDAYFKGKSTNSLSAEDKTRYDAYLKLKKSFEDDLKNSQQQLAAMKSFTQYVENVKKASNGEFSKKTNKEYVPTSDHEKRLQNRLKVFLLTISGEELESEIHHAMESIEGSVKMSMVNADSIRAVVVGDHPTDLTEKYYGCNRYEGPDAMHGTHVSGIIAATRGNGIGIDGIANCARIMVVRAVPNGDERDKDVANAIYYAVDNGATVINMSFGKYYTPNKAAVDAAIRYAESKDVLLVHAAGNDAKNKDVEDSYPTRIMNDGKWASNWIDVGASSSAKKGKKLLADFSNYGQHSVDFFAPGVDIYSTVPDAKYEDASGTSMACPATAGVAAIIRGYFPELTAAQVREVLMQTSVKYKKDIEIPSAKKSGKMTETCITGGFVNAAEAVEYLLNKK
ncbi:MAG: S8 family peptidase [Flavobacteriales bacterium]